MLLHPSLACGRAHISLVLRLWGYSQTIFCKVLEIAPLHQRLLPLAFYLPLVFAANVYLLLAAAVFFRNPVMHTKLWQWRLVIDLAFSLLAWRLGMHG